MHHLFKKIQQKKVSDRVFDQIRELIGTGQLNPGDKLPPERELVRLFEVSRSSVREAILKLEWMGFVEQRHGEGTFIKSVTESPLTDALESLAHQADFLFDLMEIRTVLECWAADRAAQKAGPEDIQKLRDCLAQMEQAKQAGQIGYQLNIELHMLIAQSAKNSFLLHIMNTISEWIRRVTYEVYSGLYADMRIYERLMAQHTAIVNAIARGDGQKASAAMSEHLRYAADMAESKTRISEKMAQT